MADRPDFGESAEGRRSAWMREVWDSLGKFRDKAEDRVLATIFVLNTGTLASLVAFVASKGSNQLLWLAVKTSAVGIFLILIYSAYAYFRAEYIFKGFRDDAAGYGEDKLDYPTLVHNQQRRSRASLPLIILAVCAAIMIPVSWAAGYVGISEIYRKNSPSSEVSNSRCLL
jgi:hypothetical protein